MAIQQVADRLVGKKIEYLFANMGETWGYLPSNPQLRWYVLLRMVILNIKVAFYLASRCKRVRDTLSEIPGTRGIIDFFLRNRKLANPLSLLPRAHHPTTQELQQMLPLFDSYRL